MHLKLGDFNYNWNIHHSIIGYKNNEYSVFCINYATHENIKYTFCDFLSAPVFVYHSLFTKSKNIIVDNDGYLAIVIRMKGRFMCYKKYIGDILPLFKKIVLIKESQDAIYDLFNYKYLICYMDANNNPEYVEILLVIKSDEIHIPHIQIKSHNNNTVFKEIYGNKLFKIMLNKHYYYIDIPFGEYTITCDKLKNCFRIIDDKNNEIVKCEALDFVSTANSYWTVKYGFLFASNENIHLFSIDGILTGHKNRYKTKHTVIKTNKQLYINKQYNIDDNNTNKKFAMYSNKVVTFLLCNKYQHNKTLIVPKYVLHEIIYYSSNYYD